MHLGIISLLSILLSPVLASTKLGCYSSIPSNFISQGEYTWQSSGHCTDLCSSYQYFALSNNICYCGNSFNDNSSSKLSDSQCSIACNGFPQETCGGQGVYNIFAMADNVSTDNESSSSSSTESESTSESTSETSSETSTSSSTTSNTSTSSSTTTSTSSSTSSSTTSFTDSSSSTESPSPSPTTDNTTTTSSTSSTSSPTTTTPPTTSVIEAVHTSQMIVVENSSQTVTSVVYITHTSTPTSTSTSNGKSSSSVNKGAIIGGVVGGVLGFLTLLFAILFLLRHKIFSKFNNNDNDDSESILADDIAYEEALKSNPFSSEDDKEADKILLGRRRLSDGSLADTNDYGMKVLRVANPDDD